MSNNTKYITKYQKENTTQVNVRLSKKYDSDIIEWLNDKEAKATYIKELIREDMRLCGFNMVKSEKEDK